MGRYNRLRRYGNGGIYVVCCQITTLSSRITVLVVRRLASLSMLYIYLNQIGTFNNIFYLKKLSLT